MKRCLISCVLLILGFSDVLMAQTLQDFTKIYDSYLAAVASDNYRRVSSFLSAEVLTEIKTRGEQVEFMKGMKQLQAIRYQTASLTISEDGQSADVQLSGRCAEDGPTRPLSASEKTELRQNSSQTQGCYLPLRFVKNAGQWKMQPPQLLGEGRPGGVTAGTQHLF